MLRSWTIVVLAALLCARSAWAEPFTGNWKLVGVWTPKGASAARGVWDIFEESHNWRAYFDASGKGMYGTWHFDGRTLTLGADEVGGGTNLGSYEARMQDGYLYLVGVGGNAGYGFKLARAGQAGASDGNPGPPSAAPAASSAAAVTTSPGRRPPDGLYNVTNLSSLHFVGQLEIRGDGYRGLEASGPFHPFGVGANGTLNLSAGLAGLEGCRIVGARYAGTNNIGQPMIKIRYVSPRGFNEELDATKER